MKPDDSAVSAKSVVYISDDFTRIEEEIRWTSVVDSSHFRDIRQVSRLIGKTVCS